MGHIDSRVSDVMNATADAPGANDDASGVALVLEAARLLSKQKFRATIVYAALSGEEQGLFGGQLLAETAKERGWTVTAVLNNDIVGNTIGTDGHKVADRVRVFSESFGENDEPRALKGSAPMAARMTAPRARSPRAIGQVAGTLPGGLQAFLVRRARSIRPRRRSHAVPQARLSGDTLLGGDRELRARTASRISSPARATRSTGWISPIWRG